MASGMVDGADGEKTSWTLIEQAASGGREERETFARRYLPIVERYLGRRWARSVLARELADATQEVFVECFQGVLARADRSRGLAFRGFLFGITRNVAARHEAAHAARRLTPAESAVLAAIPSREDEVSQVFERAWAESIVDEARRRLEARAEALSEAARRRVEVLRSRFAGGESIEEIATRLGITTKRAYKDFDAAREDFRSCLREVVRLQAATDASADVDPMVVDDECRRVLMLVTS